VRPEAPPAAALEMAAVLLPQWLGRRREGHEWLGERRANGGLGDSGKVNLNTGQWGAFATGQRGGDLVSLYAALNHLNQGAALEQVAALVGVTERSVAVLSRSKAPESPAEPIPPSPKLTPNSAHRPPCIATGMPFWSRAMRHPKASDFAHSPGAPAVVVPKGYPDPKPLRARRARQAPGRASARPVPHPYATVINLAPDLPQPK
jgi:hypothetical protein